VTTPLAALVALAAGRDLGRLGDPAELVRDAAQHRLAPLLSAELARRGDQLGEPHDRRLAFEEMADRARTAAAGATLQWAAERLATEGIIVGTAKGISAGMRWWPDPTLRPCNDVDLFVAPNDVARLGRIVTLLQPGYPGASRLGELALGGSVQYVSFAPDLDGGANVDLHVDVTNLLCRTRQHDELWRRTVLQPLANGTAVRLLDPSLAVVHLAINQLRDGFPFLVQLVDLRFALADPALDWDVVDRFVQTEGWSFLVYGSLAYGCEVLGIDYRGPAPPTGWRRRLVEASFPRSRRLRGRATLESGWARQWLVQAAMEGRGRESATAFARRLFLPAAVLDQRSDLAGPYPIRLARYRTAQLRRGAGGERVPATGARRGPHG